MSSSPVLAPSLVQLRREINNRWPARSKASDGWIGDAAHQARRSEHNPDAQGIVRAIDVTAAGIDVQTVLDATIRDSRVHYVIHARSIWSRAHGWKKRPYTGGNPHTTHIHVSIRNATSERASAATRAAAAADTRPWLAPVDTRTDLERTLDNMDEKQLRKIIFEEAHRADMTAPIPERRGTGDHWGNSTKHSAAQAAWASTNALALVQTIARRDGIDVDEKAIIAGLVDTLAPALTAAVEKAVAKGGSPQVIAEAVRRELGAAMTG